MNREVVIIGGNHHNTLSVLRSLGRKGVQSNLILTSTEKSPSVAKSRYIKSLSILNNDEKIVPYLLDNYACFDVKPVVIACHDMASSILDLNYSILEPNFILPCSSQQGRVTKYMDKQLMALLAKDSGLTIPYTCDNTDLDNNDVLFPCIVKPLISKNGSKAEISICRNGQQLSEYFFTHPNVDVQIQQYVDKEFEYQLIGCSINAGEDVVIPGRTHIMHQPLNTNTAFLRYEELDGKEPIEECIRFIKSVGYSGLFSMEFLRGKDGKDYFMEMNFRNDGNAISVTEAGVNLPYIWYLGSQGLDYSSEIKKIQPVYVMPETVVIGLWVSGIIRLRQLLQDFILKIVQWIMLRMIQTLLLVGKSI